MALLRVLAFDHEGRPVAFDTWYDDLQLYLLSDIKDSVSLFDHVSGVAPAPPATADGSTCSQWLSHDATARLAIRNHLLVAECTQFGQHRTAQALYDTVVARYSSPATAALGRLLLPYLFPELSAFATVADLVTHLRTSDARYRATVPTQDHFLSLDPTSLTVDLLEQHLLAAETSAGAVGAARGTLRPPFFERCSPSPLSPSFASAAAADVSVTEDVGAASTSAKRRSSKGKGGRGGGGGSGCGGGGSGRGGWGSGGGGGCGGGGGGGGTGGGNGGSGGGGGGGGGSGGSGGGGTGGGSETCPYVIRTGVRAGETCGKFHTEHHCFSRLHDAWRAEFGDDVERPRWTDLLRSGVAIFDLDYDAIISAMYALSFSAEGDRYRCVPPNPGIAAPALGASASGTLPGTAPALTLHTFILDFGTSRCFFRDSTTLTPLPAPVPVRLADPSGGPVVAHSSTVLPCPAVPSGSLSGLHLPSFSTNLVSTAALPDAMVTTTTPGGSSLYTLATEPPQVAASAQVSASGQVVASCSCRLLLHQTLLWHHRMGHPSLPRLRGMHSRFLVSGLPRSLPPLPPSPAPPCPPCVERQQRVAPHSSSFPLTTAPLQTLHMDVWGPARVSGQGREQYFVLVVDDYTRYTTVFPLRSKGGEFSSDLLRDFCCGEGILHSFTLLDSPQKNGIDERRIVLVMEVARTFMIHAATPHFLWPFAVRYAAHQLNLWPRVSLPETSPTLRWTGKVGDASVFRVKGSHTFVRDTSADMLSAHVTFDESVPFYRLFPYCSAPPPPPPLFLSPGPPPIDPLPPKGPASSGVSQVVPLPGTAPVQVAISSSAAPGAASRGAASGGAEPGGAGSEGKVFGGADREGIEPGGAESKVRSRGVLRLGWLVRRAHVRSGAPKVGGARDTGAGGAKVGGPGAGGAGAAVAGVGGTGVGGPRAARAGDVDPCAGGAGSTVRLPPYFVPLLQQVLGAPSSTGLPPLFLCPPLDLSQPPLQPAFPLPTPSPYTGQSGGLTERREPACRPVSPVRTARHAPRSRPPPVPGMHAMALRPSSVPLRVPLPAPPGSSLLEVPDPASDSAHAAIPTVSRLLATVVTDPSFESATVSALVVELLDFASACRLDYATALVAESVSVNPPSIGGECALGTDVLEDRLEDFDCLAASVPRFASMLLAPEGDPDVPDILTPRSYAEAITGPYSSQWQAAMDAEMASWKSTGTYSEAADWFSACPPGFTGTFPAGTQWSLRPPFYGLRQAPRKWHDTLRTTLAALGFAPSTADSSLFLRTDTSLSPFYVLVYVDDLVFATADTESLTLVKSELHKRHTCTDLGELRSYLGLQITRDRARRTITLTQSDIVHQVLQRFGFQFSSPQPTPLSTSHSLSAPPSDESVEPSGPYPELVYLGHQHRQRETPFPPPPRS
ncbi:unnamed protein product [Closterium sp. NIES-53]